QLVIDAGGFSHDTLAEDTDLTLTILRSGWHVAYEDRAVAWTEAPDTTAALLKQRFRWMYGTLQAAWKQRDAFFRPRFGSLGLVALPNLLLFQVIFPLVSPVMDLELVISGIAAAAQSFQHPLEYSPETFSRTLFYYAVFIAVDRLAAVRGVLAQAARGVVAAHLAAAAAVLVSAADVLRRREVDVDRDPRAGGRLGQARTQGGSRVRRCLSCPSLLFS